MSNVVRPPFVMCVPMPDGERFTIIYPETLLARTFPPPNPGDRWQDAMQRFFEQQELLTESALRIKLRDVGIDDAAASAQIERARKATSLNSEFSWDHITSIGYLNREGQRVVRKTSREGRTPEQRVFVLHCTVCDYEYGAEGTEIYDRQCPNCQDGPPGLPI